jgi:predicted negative regulator of RcsB-dependent stress response
MADALAKGKKPEAEDGGPTGGEDAFVRGAFKSFDWLQKNLRVVLLGVAGIALITVGVLYYVNFQATVRNQAAGDLAQLRMAAVSPEAVIPDLESYIGRYDGTPAADEARVLLARVYLDAGQPAEAIRVADGVAEGADRPLGFAARSMLAAAQESSGDAAAALATWQDLGRNARFPFQRRQAQASVARLHVAAGRVAEAATIYTAIADEAEEEGDLSEAGVYRIRLGELSVPEGS